MNDELDSRLKRLRDKGEVISASERKKIVEENEKMVMVWRKRKRMCTDILDAILESWPKSKKGTLQ